MSQQILKMKILFSPQEIIANHCKCICDGHYVSAFLTPHTPSTWRTCTGGGLSPSALVARWDQWAGPGARWRRTRGSEDRDDQEVDIFVVFLWIFQNAWNIHIRFDWHLFTVGWPSILWQFVSQEVGEESRSKKSASSNKIFDQLNFFQQLKWQLWTLLYEALAARSGDMAQIFLETANMAGAQYYYWARDRLKTRRTKQSIASFVIMIKSKEKTFCSKQCTGNFSGKRQQDVNNIGLSQCLTCTTKGWFCGGWFQLI